MTKEFIRKRVNHIREIAGDDESAHLEEDKLYEDFIDYVAITADGDLSEKAKLVLETNNIRFARWCA